MTITKENVIKVARLARIKVPENELDGLCGELDKIMTWIEQLNEVNTDGVEPLASVVQTSLYLRDDVVSDGNQQEKVLKNAPEQAAGFFVVPKVVE
ncbi:MAG: Asp-tRNA(Asn)/Glu-tRNA(Gln) amidotransferase subunit GatC [Bdellovibrionales bacterium]